MVLHKYWSVIWVNLSGDNIIIVIIWYFYSVPDTIFDLQISFYLFVNFVWYLSSSKKLIESVRIGLGWRATENHP